MTDLTSRMQPAARGIDAADRHGDTCGANPPETARAKRSRA
ncbi:hypothetical protein [Aromatoleum tolulyticum]|nr:hypothetical protein [Aromatoleum tolulyticum]